LCYALVQHIQLHTWSFSPLMTYPVMWSIFFWSAEKSNKLQYIQMGSCSNIMYQALLHMSQCMYVCVYICYTHFINIQDNLGNYLNWFWQCSLCLWGSDYRRIFWTFALLHSLKRETNSISDLQTKLTFRLSSTRSVQVMFIYHHILVCCTTVLFDVIIEIGSNLRVYSITFF